MKNAKTADRIPGKVTTEIANAFAESEFKNTELYNIIYTKAILREL